MDGLGNPIYFRLSVGNVNDSTLAIDVPSHVGFFSKICDKGKNNVVDEAIGNRKYRLLKLFILLEGINIMVELVLGSIFDKKCDLIVIPCNNIGGMTRKIEKDLIVRGIRNIPSIEKPGKIVFSKSTGDFNNAITIGFATSVNCFKIKTDIKYIRNICEELVFYCKTNSLSIINIPLLGTGAGGLSAEESYGVLKQYFESERNINLRVFVLSKEIYNQLSEKNHLNDSSIKNPRVFISYTGEDPDNRQWVKTLACKLRENGINARVDIFHLKPGNDLPQWMTNELIMADKVLLICDQCYVKKADSRNGGVGWETMIIQGDMMTHMQSNKYICIVREQNVDDGIPMYAKTKYFLHWAKPEILENDFHKLLYYLFDIDEEPELGDIPIDIKNKYIKQR